MFTRKGADIAPLKGFLWLLVFVSPNIIAVDLSAIEERQ